METTLLFIAIGILLIAIVTYPHWSYKAWYKRCEKKAEEDNDLKIASYCADHDCPTCRFMKSDGDCRIRDVFKT